MNHSFLSSGMELMNMSMLSVIGEEKLIVNHIVGKKLCCPICSHLSHWALEMWLLQTEMCSKCNIHRGLQNLSVGGKKEHKSVSLIFFILVNVRIKNFRHFGYKKMLKLISPVHLFFFLNVTAKENLKLEMWFIYRTILL